MSQKTSGFILHRFPFQDSDLILKCFTEDQGILSVLAKGAKRSKMPGYFEPFCRVNIEFFGQADLKKLRSIEPKQMTHPGFRLSNNRLYSAFYLNELLTYLIPASFSSELNLSCLFQAYENTLLKLSDETFNLEPVLRDFEITLFKTLGLWPDLSRDDLGNEIVPENFYDLQAESAARLSPSGDFQGEDLLNIAAHCWSDKKTRSAAKRLLRHWISFYAEGKPFKSRECFIYPSKALGIFDT